MLDNMLCGLRLPCIKRACVDERDSHEKQNKPPPVYDSSGNLARLRALMMEEKLEFYLVPSGDAHSSEYVGASDRRLTFLSGFTGSAGTALISHHAAHIWVDGRYWQQVDSEVDHNWTVMRAGSPKVPSWTDFLLEQAASGDRIGLDPFLFTHEAVLSLKPQLKARELSLIFPSHNLIDLIWDRKPLPKCEKIFIHSLEFAGEPTSDKLARVRKEISKQKATSLLLSDLSEIAWLFNLRGNDIENCPLFYAYAIVTLDRATLFLDQKHLSPEVEEYLRDVKADWVPVEELSKALETGRSAGSCVISGKTPHALALAADEKYIQIVQSPVEQFKSVKNSREIQGMREAYIQAALAWVRWSADLEERLHRGDKIREYQAAQLHLSYAAQQKHYFSPSYNPSVGSGYNGSMPHYMPTKDKDSLIDPRRPLVCDIGQQYRNGTTDTTRTFLFDSSHVTEDQKRSYTRVLQGHIAVDRAVFPKGSTTGSQIDVLARGPLWQDRKNYAHGTGHGIGSFLNVHEGPMMIAAANDPLRRGPGTIVLKAGNCLSNEPGYYCSDPKSGYGIRIESVVAVTDIDDDWQCFERLTKVPISTTMVLWHLLSREEKEWLRRHNADCKAVLLPLLTDKRAVKWLKRQ